MEPEGSTGTEEEDEGSTGWGDKRKDKVRDKVGGQRWRGSQDCDQKL